MKNQSNRFSKTAKDNALHFEGVKLRVTQNKDGFCLVLAIHPQEVPEELMRSLVGSRYMVAMVELTDDDQPKVHESKQKADRLVTSAALLCKEERFWKYLGEVTGFVPQNENGAKQVLCDYLEIESRSELATDKRAREMFDGMKGEFENWVRQSHGVY